MITKSIRISLLALLCLFLAAISGNAQSNYAVVRGSVLDQAGLAISGARVHIVANGTGAERDVEANTSGLYEIAGLQPGRYQLSVQRAGFQKAEETLDLEVGQQANVDVQLKVGAETQTVSVKGSGELLKTDDASVGEVVDQRSVDSLPLNGRMLIDLVLTVPGAHISHGAAPAT